MGKDSGLLLKDGWFQSQPWQSCGVFCNQQISMKQNSAAHLGELLNILLNDNQIDESIFLNYEPII